MNNLKLVILVLTLGLSPELANSFIAQTFSSGTNVNIPDGGSEVCSDISVTGVGVINGTSGLESVCIKINHAWDSDLDIYLVAPDGTRIELSTDNGGSGDNYGNGGSGDGGTLTCFDMAAATAITAGSAPFQSDYIPEGNLGDANNGQNANGTWSLCVTDDASLISGFINTWQLTFGSSPAPPSGGGGGGSTCTHTIDLYDDWGDGWNGGTIDVTVNGTTVLNNISIANGTYGPQSHNFSAASGDNIQVVYTSGGGSYDDEVNYDIYDGYGSIMVTDYYPYYDGTTYTNYGNCDAPTPSPGQDCEFPLLLCNSDLTVGNPGYSGTGGFTDFDGGGNCTGGEKNSMWVQIDIASTGNLNFNIIPNDADITDAGPETDYDFLLWKMSGSGTTTDCSTITSSSGTALAACNFSGYGVTGVASGGDAPTGYDNSFDGAYEPTVSTTAGDVYFLVIQNYSGSTQGFTVDFSNSGAGVVDYTTPSTIYWTAGSSTNDWTDQANWGNCSTTPLCGINAIVTGSVTNQPSIPTGDVRYVKDITINNGATLTLANNATLHVCGDFNNDGNIVFGNNSTIIFDGGNTTQTISGNCTGVNGFGNFVIDKTGGEVVLDCNIEIARDFSNLNNTSVLNTNGFNVTIGRHFNNFNGNTTFISSTGTLIFNGTVNQNYNEGASQLDLNNVLMNNTSTGVTLLTDMNLNNSTAVLDLTDGNIRTNNFEVFVQNDAFGAITNHSVDSYVYGNLRRNIQSLGAYEFPVGDLITYYQNAEVDFITPTSINNLLARFDPYPGAVTAQGGIECLTTYNLPNEDNGYWTITADANSSTGKYNMTLYPTNATNTAGANGWTVTKKATIGSPTWLLNGGCDWTSTVSVVKRKNMSGFSVFGVAQATIVLPSELIDFSGKINTSNNHLTWSTAAEINNDYFNLQYSPDGNDFVTIDQIDGAGNSNSTRFYESFHYDFTNVSYYRLEMVDFNNSKQYSNIVRLARDNNPIELVNLYPNPTRNEFNLELNTPESDNITIEIFDYTGKLIYNDLVKLDKGSNHFNIKVSNFAKGIYNLRMINDDKSFFETIKLIKE